MVHTDSSTDCMQQSDIALRMANSPIQGHAEMLLIYIYMGSLNYSSFYVNVGNCRYGIEFHIQLLVEGLKDMQIGGLILKIERIADDIVHIPSPHIKPEATALA